MTSTTLIKTLNNKLKLVFPAKCYFVEGKEGTKYKGINKKQNEITWNRYKQALEGDWKVRDHCHYTGQYSGAAHSKCNLAYKLPKYIPVIFHNLSGYDLKVLLGEL